MILSQTPDHVNGFPLASLRTNEMNRLSTFARYPQDAIKSAILLAKNGFVYIGTGASSDDTVRCVFCEMTHQRWQKHSDIATVHRQLSPSCPMAKGTCVANASRNNADFSHHHQYTSCSNFSLDSKSPRTSMESIISSEIESDGAMTMDSLPIDSIESNDMIRDSSYSSRGSSNDFTDSASQSQHESATPQSDASDSSVPSVAPFPSIPPSQISNEIHLPMESTVLPDAVHSSTSSAIPPSNLATSQTPLGSSQDSRQNTTSNNSSSSRAPPCSTPTSSTSTPTWQQLGISIEKPKRRQYARKDVRKQSFAGWPTDHHISIDELVQAGFYYSGYSDCARCFFCGGGLRNWELGDDVFVEHVRWFPKCGYIRQILKQEFRDAVQTLHTMGPDNITRQQVLDRIQMTGTRFIHESEANLIEKQAAVKALIDFGFERQDVLHAAQVLSDESQSAGSVCAEDLLRKLIADNKTRKNQPSYFDMNPTISRNVSSRDIQQLKDANDEMRRERTCKVCLTGPLTVLFLPCGHLVCCSDCAMSLSECPVCRTDVKGTVHVSLDL